MSLFEALNILVRVHTRDANPNQEVFIAQITPSLDWMSGVTQVEYIRAWNQIRHAIGVPSFKDN